MQRYKMGWDIGLNTQKKIEKTNAKVEMAVVERIMKGNIVYTLSKPTTWVTKLLKRS